MAKPRLYYDGPCSLCRWSITWVHRHVPGVACVPLQSEEAKLALPPDLTTPPLTGVVVVDAAGQAHVGHRALHALAPHANGLWRWCLPLVPRWGYAVVARSRHVWGRNDTCSTH